MRGTELRKLEYNSNPTPAPVLCCDASTSGTRGQKPPLCLASKRHRFQFEPEDIFTHSLTFLKLDASYNHCRPAVVAHSCHCLYTGRKTYGMVQKRPPETIASDLSGNVMSPAFLMALKMSLCSETWTSLTPSWKIIHKSYMLNVKFYKYLHQFISFRTCTRDTYERNQCQNKFKSLTNKNIVKAPRHKKPLC